MSQEDDYKTYTKSWYNQAARYYRIFDALVKGMRAKVVDVTNAPHGARILDVATGTGSQAFAFAERGYTVAGIDLSEAMLGVAQRLNTYNNVTFKLADATQMPFEDDQFTVSCVSLALHEMPSSVRERVLLERVQVTALNGTIIIIEYAIPPMNVWHSFLLRLARWGEGKYFAEFVSSDFRGLLNKVGIKIEREVPVLMRMARITRGINTKGPRESNAL
ncbi:MAG: class I SAM-dependent methyltransferase [Halobacteriota archaeon]